MAKNHGITGTPEYRTWLGMIRRCHDANDVSYHYYGGRGIYVCERWRNSFYAFLEDMGSRPEGLTLDRINNNGPYAPDNCRWATQHQQIMNRRNTINPNGDKMTILQVRMSEQEKNDTVELAKQYGVTLSTLVRLMVAYAGENLPTLGVPRR